MILLNRSEHNMANYYTIPIRNYPQHPPTEPTETSNVYRRMKFLPKRKVESPILRDSCNQAIENYVYSTKDNLDQQLPNIGKTNDYNLTEAQKQALKSKQNLLTIKPADKNLGLEYRLLYYSMYKTVKQPRNIILPG